MLFRLSEFRYASGISLSRIFISVRRLHICQAAHDLKVLNTVYIQMHGQQCSRCLCHLSQMRLKVSQ